MSDAEILLAVSRSLAAAAALVFAVSYSRVAWRVTPEGRNVMALSVCIVIVSALGAVRLVHETPQIDLVASVAWIGVAAVLVWRHRIRLRLHAEWRRTHPSKPPAERIIPVDPDTALTVADLPAVDGDADDAATHP